MHTRFVTLLAASALFVSASAAAQDFAIPYATEPSASLQTGDIVTINYEVENTDFVSASSFTVGFIVDDGVNAYLLYEDTVPSIGAGQLLNRTMTFAVPSGADGTWTSGLVADPFDTILESDENDNVYVFTTTVRIGNGTSGGTITVIADPLPAAQVGSSYSARLSQSGATSPSWYVSSGTLPPGLSLSSSGDITGVPSSQGAYSFTATAEQAGLTPGTGTFSLNVNGTMGGQIVVTPSALPDARVGVPYEAVMQATGGTPPYGYQVISEIPAWMTVTGAGAEAGTIRGTPDGVGNIDLVVYVSDSGGGSATAALSVAVIESGPLTIDTALPAGVAGKAYVGRLVSGGIPPYQVQMTSGTLPPGLTVDTAGNVTGVPTQMGAFPFEVSVTDNVGATATGSGNIAVTELQALTISSRAVVVYVGSEMGADLVATGGVPPYSWSMVGGTLPDGVSFDGPNAKIVGKPTTIGNGVVTLTVVDAEGSSVTEDVTVNVSIFIQPGRNGDRRDGCECTDPSDASPWALLGGLLALGLIRRRR